MLKGFGKYRRKFYNIIAVPTLVLLDSERWTLTQSRRKAVEMHLLEQRQDIECGADTRKDIKIDINTKVK
jgi:hypothetical protein